MGAFMRARLRFILPVFLSVVLGVAGLVGSIASAAAAYATFEGTVTDNKLTP